MDGLHFLKSGGIGLQLVHNLGQLQVHSNLLSSFLEAPLHIIYTMISWAVSQWAHANQKVHFEGFMAHFYLKQNTLIWDSLALQEAGWMMLDII